MQKGCQLQIQCNLTLESGGAFEEGQGGAWEGWGSVGAQERESNIEGGGGAAPDNPAPTPVRGPAKCGEVPDGDLGELNQQLGGELVGEKIEGTHPPSAGHTTHLTIRLGISLQRITPNSALSIQGNRVFKL